MQQFEVAGRPGIARLAAALESDGYAVLENALPAEDIAAIRETLAERFALTPAAVGYFFGPRTKRFGGILKRAPATRALVMHPDVLAIANAVLGASCDRIQLSLAEACEFGPGETAQAPFRDEALWPAELRAGEFALRFVWPLDAVEGVGMRVWRASHGSRQDYDDTPVTPRVAPGSALVLLGSVLHGAAANRGSVPHRAIDISFCLGWLKPFENQWLTYPPEIARSFDPALAEIIGYRRDRPNLGGVDGNCPSRLLDGGGEDYVAARDALTDDQAVALAAFREVQLAMEAAGER